MRCVGSLLALGIVISASVGLFLEPELFSDLLAKEGPSEHLSHSIVAVAVVAWLLLGGRRPLALLGSLFFLVVLGEETDWGAIYGDGEGFNLHNALNGHLYSLFAIPLLAFYGASLLARERLRALLGAATPERVDLWALGLCVLLAPVAGLSTMTDHERALDEVIELALYVQCAWLGIVGVAVERRAPNARRARRQRSTDPRSHTRQCSVVGAPKCVDGRFELGPLRRRG